MHSFIIALHQSSSVNPFFKIFIPSQLPPKHPRPDHLGIVYQTVSVTLYSIWKCNAWGLIYFFIFEGIHFLIIKDTMLNTEVHCMYTLCLFMSAWERSVAPTCELRDVAQLKAMVPAMYYQIFLHLTEQLAGHVKGNQRNMERHLFSTKKKTKTKWACTYSSRS